jgi:glycosyltransferase involved in cell wall biosynthesis
MHLYDDWGCGHYRCALPVNNCYGDLAKSGTSLFLQKELHSEDAHDAYIVHRIPLEPSIFFMQKQKEKGRKFVIELDDDIYAVPEWMPSEEYKNTKWALTKAIEIADEVWVSTQALADTLDPKYKDKTHVLPNLVDINTFLKPKPASVNPIRILWAGSSWHDTDLDQLVEPVERLMEEYGDTVQFLFWGCLPSGFSEYERIPGQNAATLRQKTKYGNRLLYLDGIPFRFYYDRLVYLTPTIGLCPLVDCKFNKSKSNLKFLEYTMAGAATIGTNMEPYKCIENGKDGLLVNPGDTEGWYRAMKTLIDNQSLREEMVSRAREKVYEEYSWQSQNKKNLWLDAFRRIVSK